MPSAVPSILHAFTKKVLVVLLSLEETGAQRELPSVPCVVRQQSPSSPATTLLPGSTTRAIRRTAHCLGEGCPRTLLVDSASQTSAPPAKPPGLREGISFTRASKTHDLMVTFLPAFLPPIPKACGIICGIPKIGAVTRKKARPLLGSHLPFFLFKVDLRPLHKALPNTRLLVTVFCGFFVS